MLQLRLTLALLFVTGLVFSQGKIIKNVTIDHIQQIAIDRAGDIYAITSSLLSRYDKNGKLLGTLSIQQIPTSFDTGNGVRLLMFERSNQTYTILSPSLQQTDQSQIEKAVAIEPWLICSSGDYQLLVLDAADWSIKKVDPRDWQVMNEFKIDSELTANSPFTYLREYQNFIFLLDKKNTLTIFNGIGIKLKTYSIGNQHFNFLGQELYYIKDKKIHFVDLFTSETREMELPGQFENMLITDERMIGINPDQLTFFEYNPR